MSRENSKNRLLEAFGDEEGAKDYATRLMSVLGEIDLAQTRITGLALMAILELTDITLPCGTLLEEPGEFCPNLAMIASVPATFLTEVNSKWAWWRFEYLGWSDGAEQESAIARLVECLEEAGTVRSISRL